MVEPHNGMQPNMGPQQPQMNPASHHQQVQHQYIPSSTHSQQMQPQQQQTYNVQYQPLQPSQQLQQQQQVFQPLTTMQPVYIQQSSPVPQHQYQQQQVQMSQPSPVQQHPIQSPQPMHPQQQQHQFQQQPQQQPQQHHPPTPQQQHYMQVNTPSPQQQHPQSPQALVQQSQQPQPQHMHPQQQQQHQQQQQQMQMQQHVPPHSQSSQQIPQPSQQVIIQQQQNHNQQMQRFQIQRPVTGQNPNLGLINNIRPSQIRHVMIQPQQQRRRQRPLQPQRQRPLQPQQQLQQHRGPDGMVRPRPGRVVRLMVAGGQPNGTNLIVQTRPSRSVPLVRSRPTHRPPHAQAGGIRVQMLPDQRGIMRPVRPQLRPQMPQQQIVHQHQQQQQQQGYIQQQQQTIHHHQMQQPQQHQPRPPWQQQQPRMNIVPQPRPNQIRQCPGPGVGAQQQQMQQQQMQQQVRPQMGEAQRSSGQTPISSGEIAHNVEHIFIENGVEVRKMPIKLGNETIWVDCVSNNDNGNSGEPAEDGIMFDLIDDVQTGPATNIVTSQHQQPQHPPQPVIRHPPHSNMPQTKKHFTDEEKNKIVREVLDELISPSELSLRYGAPVNAIRNWVKSTGAELPSKYKVKNMKAIQPKENPVGCPPTIHINNQGVLHHTGGRPQGVIHAGSPQIRPPPGPRAQRPLVITEPMSDPNSRLLQMRPPGPPGVPGLPQQQQVQPKEGQPEKPLGPVPGATMGPAAPAEPYKPKLIPGKLALCKNCGSTSPDFNKCVRCKKTLPEDCKVLNDENYKKPEPEPSKSSTVSNTTVEPSAGLRNIRIAPKKKKVVSDEPECIALSSDEDDDEDSSQSEPNQGSENEESNGEKEKPAISKPDVKASVDENIADGSSEGNHCAFVCRSVRIGSYKAMPKDKVIFTNRGIQVKTPAIVNSDEVVTLSIQKADVLKVLAHFGRSMPLLFVYVGPGACKRIRDALGMVTKNGFFLDIQSSDETQKRITILPEKMPDETKTIILNIFGTSIRELQSKEANDLLVRSSPKDSAALRARVLAQLNQNKKADLGNVKYCQFPPTGSSSVTVTNEDYCCLEDENFLNDVIIDFYFRYLQYTKIPEESRDRVHIFSTYFYKRLTTRPQKQGGRLHPIEDNPNLSPAEKRYERVKRWTKKVNLFEKDFIFVPINEHSHWFLAVICFPGLDGCRRMDNNEAMEAPASQKLPPSDSTVKKKPIKRGKDEKRIVQIGATTIIPIKSGDSFNDKLLDGGFSDRDEADASDDEMFQEEEETKLRALGVIGTPKKEEPKSDGDGEKKEGESKENGTSEPKAEEKQEEKKEEPEEPNEPKKEKKLEEGEIPQEEAKKEDPVEDIIKLKQPCILIFDSLNTGSRARVAATLRDYLKCEYKAKMEKERDFNKDNMKGNCPKVPQQPNFSDCGIYVLQYAESFFETPISNFALPITSLRSWFPKEVVKNKRSFIGKLIRDLASEQNPGKVFNFPDLTFVPTHGSGYTDEEDDEDDDDDDDFSDMDDEDEPVQRTIKPGVVRMPNVLRLPQKTTLTPTKMISVQGQQGNNSEPGMVIMKKDGKINFVHRPAMITSAGGDDNQAKKAITLRPGMQNLQINRVVVTSAGQQQQQRSAVTSSTAKPEGSSALAVGLVNADRGRTSPDSTVVSSTAVTNSVTTAVPTVTSVVSAVTTSSNVTTTTRAEPALLQDSQPDSQGLETQTNDNGKRSLEARGEEEAAEAKKAKVDEMTD